MSDETLLDRAGNAGTGVLVTIAGLGSFVPTKQGALLSFAASSFLLATYIDYMLCSVLFGFEDRDLIMSGYLIPWWMAMLIAAPYTAWIFRMCSRGMMTDIQYVLIEDPDDHDADSYDTAPEFAYAPYGTWEWIRAVFRRLKPPEKTLMAIWWVVALPGSSRVVVGGFLATVMGILTAAIVAQEFHSPGIGLVALITQAVFVVWIWRLLGVFYAVMLVLGYWKWF